MTQAVTGRRTSALLCVTLAGCLLVPCGALLLYLGTASDHGGESVAGILALVLGLVCLRILFWLRRARHMTRVGLSFHRPED